jgi:Ca2+/Na+ antiporter
VVDPNHTSPTHVSSVVHVLCKKSFPYFLFYMLFIFFKYYFVRRECEIKERERERERVKEENKERENSLKKKLFVV